MISLSYITWTRGLTVITDQLTLQGGSNVRRSDNRPAT